MCSEALTRHVRADQLAGVRVVVISADPNSMDLDSDSVASSLQDLGCHVEHHYLDCRDIEEAAVSRRPNIVVVEGGDNLLMASQARRQLHAIPRFAGTPMLLVTTVARLPALDFRLGFDDFVLSPIVPAELYARIRQIDWRTADFGSDEGIKIGDLVIDIAGREVLLAGRTLVFPHQEFELLRFLARNRGRVYTREQLLDHVWGDDYRVGTRTVDIHVRRLRSKLGPAVGSLIVTVRNVGYKML